MNNSSVENSIPEESNKNIYNEPNVPNEPNMDNDSKKNRSYFQIIKDFFLNNWLIIYACMLLIYGIICFFVAGKSFETIQQANSSTATIIGSINREINNN